MREYDYLIVGAGLFGSVFAFEAAKHEKKCLVIEKRSHVGGNLYTENVSGINVHKYGAHIFHTDNKEIWDYMNQFAQFNHYINSPIARFRDEVYNLPFNMNTFSKIWGICTPAEAQDMIERQRREAKIGEPGNLEEQAISLVGYDIYQKLIKEYTEKQWGRDCTQLPAFIIKRLPIRFTYDNNYFEDRWQGIPEGGYTPIICKMLENAEVRLNTSYDEFIREHPDCAEKTVYTGMLDEYFGYSLGRLAWRSLRFEEEELPVENYQGNAVVNYTGHEVPWTRIIEHKHFEFGKQPTSIISREYPVEWEPGLEPYYPVNDEENSRLAEQYRALALEQREVLFGGRLGSYRYYDMDDAVDAARRLAAAEFGE